MVVSYNRVAVCFITRYLIFLNVCSSADICFITFTDLVPFILLSRNVPRYLYSSVFYLAQVQLYYIGSV